MKRRIIATTLHLTLLLAALAIGISATVLPTTAQGSASINIILRGCPDGVDPQAVANPAAECTIPLDAPDDAGVFWGGDGQGGMSLADAERLSNGTYTISVPAGMNVNTFNFEPTVFDTYTVVGADSVVDGVATVNLTEGETRSIVFYYYHLPEGTATLDIILRGCAEGIDPQTVADPATECTIPLDAPDDAGVFWGGDGQGGMPLADTERLSNGTYTMLAPAGVNVRVFGFEPSVFDDYIMLGTDSMLNGEAMVILAPDEVRTIKVFYFHS